MHKDVIAGAELGYLAQFSLILFVSAFILIMLRAFFMNKERTEHMKELPLDDGQREPSGH